MLLAGAAFDLCLTLLDTDVTAVALGTQSMGRGMGGLGRLTHASCSAGGMSETETHPGKPFPAGSLFSIPSFSASQG